MARRDYLSDPQAPKANSIVPRSPRSSLTTSGGLLLVQERQQPLSLGGGMDPGESIAQAAVRETNEETGMDIRGDWRRRPLHQPELVPFGVKRAR